MVGLLVSGSGGCESVARAWDVKMGCIDTSNKSDTFSQNHHLGNNIPLFFSKVAFFLGTCLVSTKPGHRRP